MMPKPYNDFTRTIIQTLESLNIPYAIGGSFASSRYGEPRGSIDIDISIVLPLKDANPFLEAIRQLGYYVNFDAMVDAFIWKTPFNIIDSESGYKADMFLVEPTPLEESIFIRRQRLVYDTATGASAMLYSPEDVIIYKLKYYLEGRMEKHPRDIAAMLATRGETLDYEYIAYWANEIGANQVWQKILAEYKRRMGKDQE